MMLFVSRSLESGYVDDIGTAALRIMGVCVPMSRQDGSYGLLGCAYEATVVDVLPNQLAISYS
jgi:hypothetical protein